MENMETINKIGTETTNMPNMLYSGSYSILIMIRRAAIWSTMIYAALYKGIRMHNQSRKQTSLIASDTEWVTGFHQKGSLNHLPILRCILGRPLVYPGSADWFRFKLEKGRQMNKEKWKEEKRKKKKWKDTKKGIIYNRIAIEVEEW
jgi:hypothetical protein